MTGQLAIETIYKDGIELRKGVTLTQQFLNENEEIIKKWLNFWLLYPDLYLDAIHDPDDHFSFFFYQRIALRANMRYENHFWTATRGSAKSFLSYLSGVLKCVFLPKTTQIIVSDVKSTVIQTATQKFNEIWQHWPLLRKELQTRADDGVQGEKKSNDYYELWFKNGSHLTVISKDTSRGLRATAAILEECALIEEYNYNSVILPQMNVPRQDPSGTPNPEEPFATQSFITTASDKNCFMYGKLIELAVKSIVNPKSTFVWG